MREIDTSCAIQRTSVPALDQILGHAFPVLDHGFVRVVDYMGDDAAVVQMARVSYGAGTKSVSSDEGLLRYLMRQHHTSPFEGCEIKLHVKLPVFVARQWIRHRTANVNEYSARYSILDREFYIPDNVAFQSSDNKQGRGELMPQADADHVREIIRDASDRCYTDYEEMVTETGAKGLGVARELARVVLPTNIYTQWYWKTDLHNLLHFLTLRSDGHAQSEIRDYANVIADLVKQWVPKTYQAWVDYKRDAVSFSRMELRELRTLVSGAKSLTFEGMSEREIADFRRKLGWV